MRTTPHPHADRARLWLVTGATGLLGGLALRRLLAADPALRAVVLLRDPAAWPALRRRLGAEAARLVPAVGDVTHPGLGLAADDRRLLARHADAVLHCAADTSFARPLDAARRVNTAGTAHVLDLAAGWRRPPRVVLVSTAFVAGRRTGFVHEDDAPPADGWVNAYERSKAEAETLLRAWPGSWLALRSSTVACDDAGGAVTQHNAVHRALRLCHAGLVAMLPDAPASAVDCVPASWVADAIAALSTHAECDRTAVHLCAGEGALPLDELLARTWAAWSRHDAWRRRQVPRPALCDLETYGLYERSAHEVGDARLRRVVAALGHFAPQLAYAKTFHTGRAEALLGAGAPPVRQWWEAMVGHLQDGWRGGDAGAALDDAGRAA